MAFKLKSGNKTTFKMMGSSPVKKADPGIFVGEGDLRRRVSEDEASSLEAEGVDVTYTAADNPDKEKGEQQIKNLGPEYAAFDANLQNRINRGLYTPETFLAMGTDEPLTIEKAEKTIRKHENLEGGNPMVIEGSQYFIHPYTGEKVLLSEWDGPVDKDGNPMITSKTKPSTVESETKTETPKNKNVITINGEEVEGKGEPPVMPKIEGDPSSPENQKLLKEYYRALKKWQNN